MLRGVLKTWHTSKLGFFSKVINGFHPWTIFSKSSILDAWNGFEYLSGEPEITDEFMNKHPHWQ